MDLDTQTAVFTTESHQYFEMIFTCLDTDSSWRGKTAGPRMALGPGGPGPRREGARSLGAARATHVLSGDESARVLSYFLQGSI